MPRINSPLPLDVVQHQPDERTQLGDRVEAAWLNASPSGSRLYPSSKRAMTSSSSTEIIFWQSVGIMSPRGGLGRVSPINSLPLPPPPYSGEIKNRGEKMAWKSKLHNSFFYLSEISCNNRTFKWKRRKRDNSLWRWIRTGLKWKGLKYGLISWKYGPISWKFSHPVYFFVLNFENNWEISWYVCECDLSSTDFVMFLDYSLKKIFLRNLRCGLKIEWKGLLCRSFQTGNLDGHSPPIMCPLFLPLPYTQTRHFAH